MPSAGFLGFTSWGFFGCSSSVFRVRKAESFRAATRHDYKLGTSSVFNNISTGSWVFRMKVLWGLGVEGFGCAD